MKAEASGTQFTPLPLLSEEETERRYLELVARLKVVPDPATEANWKNVLRHQGEISLGT